VIIVKFVCKISVKLHSDKSFIGDMIPCVVCFVEVKMIFSFGMRQYWTCSCVLCGWREFYVMTSSLEDQRWWRLEPAVRKMVIVHFFIILQGF
jgi:predicted nucleic-acid-binding Zn-ribbon protein